MFTLWFDVKIEEYTTSVISSVILSVLWFDVKIEEYTTRKQIINETNHGCGLM